MRRVLLLLCLAAGGMNLANASIIPIYVSTSDLGGGVFAYNYDVFVESPGQRVQGATIAGLNNVPAAGFDNHFTFFDFFGYVAGSASCTGPNCSGFTASASATGPAAYKQSPTDDPVVVNVTWTYDVAGAPIPSGSLLGRFTMNSTSGNPGVIDFSGQGTKQSGPLDGTVAGNTVSTIGPVASAVSVVPEPGAMLLMGIGLIGLGLFRRKLAGR